MRFATKRNAFRQQSIIGRVQVINLPAQVGCSRNTEPGARPAAGGIHIFDELQRNVVTFDPSKADLETTARHAGDQRQIRLIADLAFDVLDA